MGFDINRFRSELVSEPASQSKFQVTIISAPRILSLSTIKSLRFKCEEAELPGKVISTTDFKDYGPTRKIAYSAMYNDVSFQFICTDEMIEKKLFEDWHRLIIDDLTDSDVEYYSNYTGEILIEQFSRDGKSSHKVVLEEAYPISVAAMPLAWSATNQYHKMTVEVAYRSYRSN